MEILLQHAATARSRWKTKENLYEYDGIKPFIARWNVPFVRPPTTFRFTHATLRMWRKPSKKCLSTWIVRSFSVDSCFFFFFLHMRILKENGIDTRIFNLRKIDFFPCSLNRDFLSIIDFWSSFISFLKKIESERKNLMIVIKLRYITISVQRFENSISTINLYHFSTNLLYALIIEILKKISWKFSKIISRQYMSDVK